MTFQNDEAERGQGLAPFQGQPDEHAALAGVGLDLVMDAAEVGTREYFGVETGLVTIAGLGASGRNVAIEGTRAWLQTVVQQAIGGEKDVLGGQHLGEETARGVPDHGVPRGGQLHGDVMAELLDALAGPDQEQLRVERPGVGLEDQFSH